MKAQQTSYLFDLYDVPDIFFRERVECKYFEDTLNAFINDKDEEISDNRIFLLMHLSNRQFVYLNFYNYLVTELRKQKEYRNKNSYFLAGFITLLYTSWDFQFNNTKNNILSGKSRFSQYFNNEFYDTLPESEKFVQYWFKNILDANKVNIYLDSLIENENTNFDELDALDQEIIKILKDCITISPIYFHVFFNDDGDDEFKKTHFFNLIMILETQYGICDLEKIIDHLNNFKKFYKPNSKITEKVIQKSDYGCIDTVFSEADMNIFKEVQHSITAEEYQHLFKITKHQEINLNSQIF